MKTWAVHELRVRLERGDLHDADPVLLARADGDGRLILDEQGRVGADPRLDIPAEEHILKLLLRGLPFDLVVSPLYVVWAGFRSSFALDREGLRFLDDEAAVHERLEVDDPLRLVCLQPLDLV